MSNEYLRKQIEHLRPRLLDLSKRNPLIATRLTPRSASHVRVVDELPDVLYFRLREQHLMKLDPLPPLDAVPKDEETAEFQDALTSARLTDETYLAAVDQIDPTADDALQREWEAERELRDRLREMLGLQPRPSGPRVSLSDHARVHGITPDYDLPTPSTGEEPRHYDDSIQTLLLPEDLERRMNALMAKSRTWMQETGINVMRVAFGFLEWAEPQDSGPSFAPLVLLPADVARSRSGRGHEFRVKGLGDNGETNTVLAEMLRRTHGLELPEFTGGSLEEYFEQVADLNPTGVSLRVRRQVAIGVWPSSKMAMFHDLNTDDGRFDGHAALTTLFVGSVSDQPPPPFAEDYDVDDPKVESKVPVLVLDADSSQVSTMFDVANGRNLAVEGPPGTGKSQTIVNTIANALCAQKKVLFVAEKMAALDVVRSRLEAAGLGEFVLPLQAGRATREEVIQSLRARVETRASGPVRDYEAKRDEYRKHRDEIARYIEVMKRKFQETEFTVREILARSIATWERLRDLPRELRLPEVRRIDDLNRERIHEILRVARDTEQAWEEAQSAADWWRDVKVSSIDRLRAEAIAEEAREAAREVRQLVSLRQALTLFGLDSEASAGRLSHLADFARWAAGQPATLDIMLVGRMMEAEPSAVTSFLDTAERCRTNRSVLENLVEAPLDPAWPDHLGNLGAYVRECGFSTLDVSELRRELDERRAELARTIRLRDAIGPLVVEVPNAAHWRLDAISAARRIVEKYGPEVIAARSSVVVDPAAATPLRQAIDEGRRLLQWRTILALRVDTDGEFSAEDLDDASVILKNAGFFRFLSGSYRRAKRLYLRMSLDADFDRFEAARDLAEFARFKREERRYREDPRNSTMFGLNFSGLDTNFALYENLLEFLAEVDRALADPGSRELRKYLKSADQELISLLPQLEDTPTTETFAELETQIEDANADLARRGEAIDTLATRLQAIREPATIAPGDLSGLADRIASLQSDFQVIQSSPLKETLGDRFRGLETTRSDLEPELSVAERLGQLDEDADGAFGLLLNGQLIEGAEAVDAVREQEEVVTSRLTAIQQATGLSWSCDDHIAELEELAATLEGAGGDESGLLAHARHRRMREEMAEFGLAFIVERLDAEERSLRGLDRIVEAVLYRALAQAVYDDIGNELRRYSGVKLDRLRQTIADLDRKLLELNRHHLRGKLIHEAKPPMGNGTGPRSTWTEYSLIQNEIAKQRRHVSPRDLTIRAGRALQELKPCWMMSPLAVANYLPHGGAEFHLVIIDEASQMTPENAVGAIARGGQAVIVGDTNQLPPTSFFARMIGDGDDDDDEDGTVEESILEMANRAFHPRRRLRWHYRSRNSELIRFSNHRVYDDQLVLFPSASEDGQRRAVKLIKVDGLYKSGVNEAEAKTMVEAALRHMKTQPNRSLGLVTLNQKQRDVLIDEMEYALLGDPSAEKYIERWNDENDGIESFFIKNLENVQGDERDVIFIGTVYGPSTPGGPTYQRFGPINGIAGKRRLNVLFSRAKHEMVTFTSMTPADIRLDRPNEGKEMLRAWLEYAGSGVLPGQSPAGHGTAESPFEEYVIERIRRLGYEAVPQVGTAGYFIDIGVKHPDWPYGYILGVECDGATYHSARSARDRDRLRQEVLEQLGWSLHRIWSTDWFSDPDRETERLRDRIEKRLSELRRTRPPEEPEPEPIGPEPQPSPPAAEGAPISKPREPSETKEAERPIVDGHRGERIATATGRAPTRTPQHREMTRTGVDIGDRVRVRYLEGTKSTVEVVISDSENNPAQGVVGASTPLGEALLGAEEGEEIEVLVGSYVRKAIVEHIQRTS